MNRRWALLNTVLACAYLGQGCDCESPALEQQKEDECKLHSDCPPGKECDPDSHTCVDAYSFYCDVLEDCEVYGADYYCEAAVHRCVSHHECSEEEPCPNDMECQVDANTGYRVCVYPGCDSDEECITELAGQCQPGTHARCILRECICQDICGGPCGDNRVCCADGDTATCIDTPEHCAELECSPGHFGQADSEMPWSVEECDYTGDQCSCQELPHLPWGDIGDPFVMRLNSSGTPVFAAYNNGFDHHPRYPDTVFGDLMLGYASDATTINWTFVDGVPVAAVEAGPSGPRGGILEPGDDVGEELDLVLDSADRAHLVYRDSSNGRLRYARVDPTTGATTLLTVDREGDTGRFPSIALDPTSGAPRISYFTRRVELSPDGAEARLRLAVATLADPMSVSDFVHHTPVAVDLTAFPCEDGCPDGEVCQDAVDPAVDFCVVEDDEANCPTQCGDGFACVAAACVPVVADPLVRMTPAGVGLFSKIGVRPNGSLFILAYDSVERDLVVVRPAANADLTQPGALFVPKTIDGQNGLDIGTHIALTVASDGTSHMAYVDNSQRAIIYAQYSPSATVEHRQVVHGGLFPGPRGAVDNHLLEDPAIALDNSGARVIAFQDATSHALWRCSAAAGETFNNCTWLLGGESGSYYRGSFGFSTNAAFNDSGTAILSSYRFWPVLDAAYDNGITLVDYPTPTACHQDVFESNNTRLTATPFESAPLPGHICRNDIDWFSISAETNQTIMVTVGFTHSQGDLDIELYDSSDTEVADSQTVDDWESLTYNVTAGGSFALKIYGYDGAENSYSIVFDVY